MINQYPLWKNLLIVVVFIVAVLYALPNLYGEDPALQISSSRGTPLDEAAQTQVQDELKRTGIPFGATEKVENGLLARFHDTESQLKAKDAMSAALGGGYVVALNLAPKTPDWLSALGASPMYLGLDLRGGVHFQMQVDMPAAMRQAEERYVNDFRTLLRNEKLRYLTVVRHNTGGVEVKFRTLEERDQGREVVRKEFPTLQFKESEQGGEFYFVASLSEDEQRETRRFAVQQNITALRNRVNELGVSEPVIQQQGQDRIVVQLPGVQDTVRAKEILGGTATLEFRMVDQEHNVQEAVTGRVPPGAKLYKERNGNPILLQKRVIVTGNDITNAKSTIDAQTGDAAVSIDLNSKAGKVMGSVTKDNVGKPMAVVFIETRVETTHVNGVPVKTRKQIEEVINVAVIRSAFSNSFQITGLDSSHEARDLALLLRAGALAAPMEIVEERTVGPSLGQENIDKGMYASIVSFIVVAIFMVVYYRVFGIIANIALALNVVLIIAVMSLIQATLTLPGIAAIALTIGMAVDANVLIYERIREELRNGNTPQASIHSGFARAFATIADSNITTLIAAAMLFVFGTGPVKGFAVVLTIGILSSMFTAIMVSRSIINVIYGGRKVARLAI